MQMYSDRDWERRLSVARREPNLEYRHAVRRDYARVIHSAAFRRLQGKTQLFSGVESDFFRNRLTHSLEVAQIGKSIARRLNEKHKLKSGDAIDPDVVEIAGLLHDIGHPPFGHNGEKALDDRMKEHGGFEGNAQTLRIISVTEKKEKRYQDRGEIGPDGTDWRLGLNLTYRTMASVLKYDKMIPVQRTGNKLQKGYYQSEASLVEQIKRNVGKRTPFKTVECQIMDLADDIAYSTYDLEDALKAGFLTLSDLFVLPMEIAAAIGSRCNPSLSASGVEAALGLVGKDILSLLPETLTMKNVFASMKAIEDIASDGYLRVAFTASLVDRFIQGAELHLDPKQPQFSTVTLKSEIRKQVEALKNFTFVKLINSPMLKVAEYRGYDVVQTIFDELNESGGKLLPPDYQNLFESHKEKSGRMRTICDFVAGMTDRYALEFYGRLRSENPQSIFKPL